MHSIVKLAQRFETETFKQFIRYSSCLSQLPSELLQLQNLANPSRHFSVCKVFLKSGDTQNIKARTQKAKSNYGYSIDDDNFIANNIKLYGDDIATRSRIGKELGKDQNSIRIRYKFHIANKPKVKGTFSPKEDTAILDYFDKNGTSRNAIEDLTLILGRSSPHSVRTRHIYLTAKNVRSPKPWTLEDDAQLVRCLINDKANSGFNLELENVKFSDFENVATELHRTPGGCYNHWYQVIAPILKTHTNGLSLEWNWLWQKHIMLHITRSKLESYKDVNINALLTEKAFSGQTYASLAHFVNGFTFETRNQETKKNIHHVLWQSVAIAYQNRSFALLYFNQKRQKRKIEQAQIIIEQYEKLIR